jgi:uncharacterized protein
MIFEMKREERSRKKRVLIIFAAIMLAPCLSVLWAFLIEPNRLVVREVSLSPPNWPAQFNQLRVVVISDIHGGSNFINEAKIREIVLRANQTQPDLIVLLGDFVTGGRGADNKPKLEPERVAGNLKGLSARYGVFAVLGNHDWWYNGQRVKESLQSAGIKVLENEATPIEINGRELWLAGLADLWTRPQRIEATLSQIPEQANIIALTHNPDIFPNIPARVPLTLAGHTHGGQVNLPLIGCPVTPSQYGQRYVAGLVEENNHDLFITTGIGTSIIPLRFRVPPEIVVLTLSGQT